MRESVKSLRIPRFRRFTTVQLLVALGLLSSLFHSSKKSRAETLLSQFCFLWSCYRQSLRSPNVKVF